jgi:anaerobic selenocysteine-containing dehydrogenase
MNIQQPPSLLQDDGQPAATVLKSVCRSCHGGCGVLLHVRDGVLLKVEGDRESPLNHGRLCPIGTVTTDLVYHKDRLKYPLRRKGKRQSGNWERITWDDALDEIARRVLDIRERHGPEAIASAMRSALLTGASRASPNASTRE